MKRERSRPVRYCDQCGIATLLCFVICDDDDLVLCNCIRRCVAMCVLDVSPAVPSSLSQCSPRTGNGRWYTRRLARWKCVRSGDEKNEDGEMSVRQNDLF